MVRIAIPEDYPEVLEVFYSARDALKQIGIDQWQLGVPGPEHFAADLEAGRGDVIEIDGRLAAYCSLSETPNNYYPTVVGAGWTHPEAPYFIINRLAVHQDFARRGLAQQLLAYAMNKAVQHNQASGNTLHWHVRLDTHPGNIRMHQLLETLGYKLAGTVNYPMPGETQRYCHEGLPTLTNAVATTQS